jgi:hypothetical protein
MDGRLAGAERERAIKLLGNSEAAFEIYAHAVRARADLDEVKVLPITTGRRSRARTWRVAVPFAAAAVLMIAILPAVQARRGRSAADAPVSSVAGPVLAMRSNLSPALGARWDERGWPIYRGAGSALVDSTTAFRLGVRATDLQVALAAGDGSLANRLLDDLLELLRPLPLADAAVASYEALRGSLTSGQVTADAVARATRAEDGLRDFLDSRWFGFGKWFAAGQVAARARSTPFFAAPLTTRFLHWAIQDGGLASDDVELLRQVAALTDRGVSDQDFATIEEKFAQLIRRHAE